MQEIDISAVASTFTLTVGTNGNGVVDAGDQTTVGISTSGSAGAVKTALEALTAIATNGVYVTRKDYCFRDAVIDPSGNVYPVARIDGRDGEDDRRRASAVEVGVVVGLGMTMFTSNPVTNILAVARAGSSTRASRPSTSASATAAPRSPSAATFSILPPTRQDVVVEFIHTTAAMKVITGGDGADSLRVLSTGIQPRATVDRALDLLHTATTAQGDTGTTDETQTLERLPRDERRLLHAPVQLPGDEADPVHRHGGGDPGCAPLAAPPAVVDAADDRRLRDRRPRRVTGWAATSPSPSIARSATRQLVAQVVTLLVDGGEGNDKLRVQSIFEETWIKGGDETGASGGGTDGDTFDLNVDVNTLTPIGPQQVIADIAIDLLPRRRRRQPRPPDAERHDGRHVHAHVQRPDHGSHRLGRSGLGRRQGARGSGRRESGYDHAAPRPTMRSTE